MKTKLSALIALVLFFNAANAQFNLGGKAGVNITKIQGKSFEEEFRYGYHAGGFVEIGLGKKVSIQPEVLFNQYQTRLDSNFSNIYQNAYENTRDVKLNYLSIPLVLNYKLLSNKLILQAGPQYGILLDQNKNLLQNGEQAFKNGEFSLLGGAEFRLGGIRLTGRYVVGLNNINDIDDKDEWKSQALQISLGLSL